MTEQLQLDPRTTGLVLIDLQQGILMMPTAPHSPPEILRRAAELATAFRSANALVVLVRVSFSASGADVLMQPRDANFSMSRQPGWDDLSPDLGHSAVDVLITKHQWGAFYGTELDLQLRRRGIQTLVLGGISTNFGVESTARDAFERGYSLVFVEDVMAAMAAEAHAFACQNIFPRIGRVRPSAVVLSAISHPGSAD